ncbi:MAG: glycosyltransferase family 4 protein [Thermodesulfobacteriota bacterium]
MNILIVNRFIALLGGVERYLIGLCEALSEKGVQVDFLYAEDTPNADLVAKSRKRFVIPEIWQQENRLTQNTRGKLLQVLQESRPDFIFFQNVENAKAMHFLSSAAPSVRYIHHHKATCPDGKRLLHHPESFCLHPASFSCILRAHFRRCMPRLPSKAWTAYRRATSGLSVIRSLRGIVVSSHFMKAVLIRNRIRGEVIHVLHHFPPWEPEDWVAPGRPKGLLFVGRLVPGKGIQEIIEMMAHLENDITLEVVGDGELRLQAELLTRSKELQDRITFSGWLSGSDLMEAYRRNALLVVPAMSPEPFGVIGIEAAALCRPAVAFDVGGISEWLKDRRTGMLVKPGDFLQFNRAIEHLLTDPRRLRELGNQAAQFTATHFSRQVHIARLMNIIEGVRRRGDSQHRRDNPFMGLV